MARADKEAIVEELSKKISQAKSMILTDYKGLNVADMTLLRKQLRESGIEYRVVKNTLARIAAKKVEMDNLNEFINGSIAIAFGVEDVISPAKILLDFSKNHDALEIKAGMLEGNIINVDRVKYLAEIPPRDVLLAKLFASMKAPLGGLVNVLQGNLRNLVYILNQIKEQKA
jgi:large subunit ribosomal protein L10